MADSGGASYNAHHVFQGDNKHKHWPFVVGTLCFLFGIGGSIGIGYSLGVFSALPVIPKAEFRARDCEQKNVSSGCNVTVKLNDDNPVSVYAFFTSQPFTLEVSVIPESTTNIICIDDSVNWKNAPCIPANLSSSFTLCCASTIGFRRIPNISGEVSFDITFNTWNNNKLVCDGCVVTTATGWIVFGVILSLGLILGCLFLVLGIVVIKGIVVADQNI